MSLKYSLQCSHCEQSIEVGIPQAGQEVVCSHCNQASSAPRLGELKRLPVVGGQSSQPQATNRASRSKSGLFVAGLLLTLLGLGGGGGLYAYGNSLIVDFNVEGGLDRQDREWVDKLEAHEVVAYYDALPIEEGLGEWKEQPHVSSTRQGQILTKFAFGVLGIGVIGLILIFLGIR